MIIWVLLNFRIFGFYVVFIEVEFLRKGVREFIFRESVLDDFEYFIILVNIFSGIFGFFNFIIVNRLRLVML